MLPLRDNIPSRTVPFINYAMIGLCTVVFLLQLLTDAQGISLVERYGMIPVRVFHPEAQIIVPDEVAVRTPFGIQVGRIERPVQSSGIAPVLTLVTCIFLHGGWMHYLGNMWFLFIFGDNVEDRLGHVGYLLFYLGAGVAASATHLWTNTGSMIPTIGASGAIAGVMGAYYCMYPRAMVLSVIPIYIFIETVVLPAPIFLGIWFAMQLFQGVVASGAGAGVAWWAHIGGFVAGYIVARGLEVTHHLRPPVTQRLAQADHSGMYRASSLRDLWND